MVEIKKIKHKVSIQGEDGNAFVIMGRFSHDAKKAGWTKEEIENVMTEAQSSDYAHLLKTIRSHCE